MTRVLFVTPNLANNSIGRTYCLWLLARHLGWSSTVVGVRGEMVWSPLSTGAFAEDVQVLTSLPSEQRDVQLAELATAADVVIAVKALPSSLGVSWDLSRKTGTPLLLDVDDLDLEVRMGNRSPRRIVKDRLLTGRYRSWRRMRRLARKVPTTTCNPVLQEMYGGMIVPHVRHAVPLPAFSGGLSDGPVVVRFVGSPRGHKGLPVLRAAVARHAGAVRLEVTAAAPADAAPWEGWLGQTTLEEGLALVATADVIALPSEPQTWSFGQLPAKLIDAMVFGRPVVASDLPPLRWALGGAGLLVPPSDVDALADALGQLRDPGLRQRLGSAAHAHAMAVHTVEAVAPAFADYVTSVIASSARP